MEIYLVRHTTPKIEKGICYGQADLEVTSSFRSEFERLQPHLPTSGIVVYSSPLQRCHKLASQLSVAPSLDDRLKEMSFGEWELKSWSEIPRVALNEWMEDFVDQRPPGGESFQDLKDRVLDFWKELLAGPVEAPLILATHGGVIRVIVCHLLQVPLANVFNFHLDYGSVTKIASHSKTLRVEYINR